MENVETVDQIKTRVIGIDIRIKRTTIALVDIRGEIVAQDHFATSDYADLNDYITALSENIFALVEENGGYESARKRTKRICQMSLRRTRTKSQVPTSKMMRMTTKTTSD